MPYSTLADVVVLVHFAFVLYVVFGGFLAWKWIGGIYPHLAAAAYGLGIVVIGWTCPLTVVEWRLRELGGDAGTGAGFVERWIEGVLYPGQLTPVMRVLAAATIAVSWLGLWARHSRRRARPSAIQVGVGRCTGWATRVR